MKKIGVSANPTSENCREALGGIVQTIEEQGCEVLLEEEIAHLLGKDGISLQNMESEGGIDILVTVGGDGTVLRALRHCNATILGVHIGRVGFLNEVTPEKFKEDLQKVLAGECFIDLHTRIQMCIDGEPLRPVLNEVVIHSAQAVKIREFELYLDGNKLDHFRSDGVIVATPTGSTGYALSAGGPLLDPKLEGMLVLPLAPFRIAKRPNVVPLDSVIKLKMVKNRPCIANLDGQEEIELKGTETMEFTRSDSPAKFLRFESNPYRARQRAFEHSMQ
ncbi:MAG: NAD(+)/NADH kinase [Thermoplasmata archaeon]|nr:NAD(+)/NADH kinase [Thermoplasmata archaeon]